MSFGWGLVHCKSVKQKINTKSSTEAEIVGVSDYLPFPIWMRYFVEAQGHPPPNVKGYQDNVSATRMEKNGKKSCTGNSRHIHIKYFFVKDRIDNGEISIEYCPTEEMLADFFTKPLQGALFRKFRAVIMGWEHIDSLKSSTTHVIKERVGNTDFYKKVLTQPAENDTPINGDTTHEHIPSRTYADAVRCNTSQSNDDAKQKKIRFESDESDE
mmetsp:Transcript_19868/g.22531  ORF Transcript_19868/g.22531 Transcript_19868/m.22531 type:complete len:213 (-) Transcript_19868:60-698(-)